MFKPITNKLEENKEDNKAYQNARTDSFLNARNDDPQNAQTNSPPNAKADGPVEETKGVTLSKEEIIKLIKSNDNKDELFGLQLFNDGVIPFYIFIDMYKNNLIEAVDHKIEIIEQPEYTEIKASRIEPNARTSFVVNEIKFPATKELLIVLTKDGGIDYDNST